MAAPGAGAVLTYGQNCRVVVRPGRVYTVVEDDACRRDRMAAIEQHKIGNLSVKDSPPDEEDRRRGGGVFGDPGAAGAGSLTTNIILGTFVAGIVAGAVVAAASP